MIKFDIKLDKKLSEYVKRLNEGLPGVLDNATMLTASYGKGLIIRSTAKDTGRTQGGWSVNRMKEMVYMIWNRFDWAKYLETGTGLFGPLHHMIHPKTAKFMRWPIIGGAQGQRQGNTVQGFAFASSTKGMPAQPAIAHNVERVQKDLNIRVRNAIRKLFKASKRAA
jgi:hypothetical protein